MGLTQLANLGEFIGGARSTLSDGHRVNAVGGEPILQEIEVRFEIRIAGKGDVVHAGEHRKPRVRNERRQGTAELQRNGLVSFHVNNQRRSSHIAGEISHVHGGQRLDKARGILWALL